MNKHTKENRTNHIRQRNEHFFSEYQSISYIIYGIRNACFENKYIHIIIIINRKLTIVLDDKTISIYRDCYY